jgi:hypothetical protein
VVVVELVVEAIQVDHNEPSLGDKMDEVCVGS